MPEIRNSKNNYLVYTVKSKTTQGTSWMIVFQLPAILQN